MEYDIITWENINEAIEIIAKQIEDTKIHYEVLYGLARGGLVPAVMLSHRLNIPMVLNMEYFDEQKFDIAALFVREHTSKVKPKYSYKNINHNNWLLFPWETKDSSK